jgi:Rps23 Pro-64 3,4-dihydroxylase Tpa1-like proline 4-hydroxylase
VETYKDKIFVIRDFITKEQSQELVSVFSNSITSTPDSDLIKSGFSISFDQKEYFDVMNKDSIESSILKKISGKVSDHYGIDMEIKSMFHSIMEKGASNPPHWDNQEDSQEDDISALLYLNNNFSGGLLRFINHNIVLIPEPGMLVFFKGEKDLLHSVEEVTGGSRQALVGFCWPSRGK